MWWRKSAARSEKKILIEIRRVPLPFKPSRWFDSLEGLSGLPFNNQGGTQVPWWCNTQLKSTVKFRNENSYWGHIKSNWRNEVLCLGSQRPTSPYKELFRHHQVIWCNLRDLIGWKHNSFCSLRVDLFPVAFLSIFAKICIFVHLLIFQTRHQMVNKNCIIFLRIPHFPAKSLLAK